MLSQSFGSLPWSIERWNMMVNAGVRWSAHCFRTLFGMLSGPDALEGFIFRRSFATPSCVILMFGMFCWILFRHFVDFLPREN